MTHAQRSFSLGRVGEQRWRMLAGAYQLDPGMGRALIIAEPRDVRDEIRRRLLSLGPLTVLVPSVSVLEQIHGLAGGDQIPIVWIEATTDTAVEDEWGRALMALNRGRDLIGDGGPVFVVLAGDRRFYELLSLRAPDLNHVLSPFLFEERLEMLGEPSGPLCWMHLSDLHVSGNDWEQDVVLRSLVRDLPGLLERAERRPQLLFVTGDISNRGKEFEAARRVIEELRKKLGIESTRVFVVPGNHDVDRGAIGIAAEMARRGILQLDAEARRHNVGNIVSKPEEMQLFGKRLANWCAFTEKLGRRVTVGEPWRSDVVDVAGVAVGVASLCSAWLSGDGSDDKKLALRDDKNLALGEPQLRGMIEQLEQAGAQLRVALLHHPPTGWLADVEAGDVESLLNENFDLVLHGHLHRRDAKVVSRGSGATIWMGAGAAYDRHADDRWYGFFVGQLDGARTEVSIDAFTWTSHSGGHWHPDAGFNTQEGSNRRTQPFRPPRIGKSEAVAEVRDDAIAARICQSAARVYQAHAFVGLPDSTPKPATSLTSIYVVPSLVRAEFQGLGTRLAERSVDELADLARQAHEPQRDVILGPPGSGKSTMCRHVALEQARQGERVPLLFIVREWAADGARTSLLDAVAKQVSDSLSVPLDRATVEHLCEGGKVMLIVDGVDELGERERARLRDMIQGFVVSFPRVSVMATSRELGYDEVPLLGFNHWRIAEFDDPRLRDFVDRWYAGSTLQPQERARKRAELLAAFDAEPRVKQLARNPLLATLIALVQTHRGELPGRRARLYELCVELLVVTWPATSHRTLPELPGEWQVARLEELALWMLRRRDSKSDGGGILVSGDDLEAQLRELLAKHRDDLDESRRRRLAGRWLRWLVASGLLQEQRHDAYGFLHLSIMEYLAGRGLLREQLGGGHEQVADFVARHQLWPQWAECLLLMLGSEASDAELCGAVVDRLLSGEQIHPPFWLALLREEIGVGAQRRTCMLETMAWSVASSELREWPICRKLVSDIMRFSRVHGEATRAWIDAELGRRSGEQLFRLLMMVPETHQPETLTSRDPGELQLVPLLELGDIDAWGRWALMRARATDWLEWARTAEPAAISTYALMGTKPSHSEHASAWIIGVLRRSVWLTEQINAARSNDEDRWRLRWSFEGGATTTMLVPAYSTVGPVTAATETRGSIGNFRDVLFKSSLAFASELGQAHRLLGQETAERFLHFNQAPVVHVNLRSAWGHDRRKLMDPECMDMAVAVTEQFVYGRNWNSSKLASLKISPSGLGKRPRPDANPELPWTLQGRLPEPLPASWIAFVAILANVHAGQLIDPADTTIATAFVHNLWINLFFDAIVANAQSDGTLSPSQHALLLALGLAQFQTTWHWPLSDHWHTWFSTNTPPDDPIAAHVWHLCWLAAEPDNPHHREQANACLDRATWPELAAALREFTIS